MNIEYTGCSDCLLCERQESGTGYCIHPAKKGNHFILEDEDGGKITPSDCPLFIEPITISLKQN